MILDKVRAEETHFCEGDLRKGVSMVRGIVAEGDRWLLLCSMQGLTRLPAIP